MALDSQGRPVYGTPEGTLRQAIATLERQQMRKPTSARAAKIKQLKQQLAAMGVDYTKGLAVPSSMILDDESQIPIDPSMFLEGDSWGSSQAAAGFDAAHAEKMARLEAELDAAHAEKMARLEAELQAAAAAGDFEREKQLLALPQQFEREMDAARREAERQARIEQMKQERLQIYTEMLGRDPVRAALYAMGVGGELTGLPGVNVEELGPIEGAEQRGKETAKAVQQELLNYGAYGGQTRRLTGSGGSELVKQQGTGGPISRPEVSLSGEGVSGLPSAVKAARGLMQGNEAARTLLTSAYGVGNKQTQGVSPEELMAIAERVTPKGALQY
jgi:hypothetical protein